MKKPRDIVYGANEAPPLGVTILSGFQHVGIIGILLVYPLLVAREASLPTESVFDFLGMSMLMLGIASVLQALPRGPVGAHFLAPPVFTAAYLTPSLTALHRDGLPLVLGMTAFGGIVEVALSRVLRRLRPYFPSELSGFVVTMIGVSVGLLGLRYLLETRGRVAPGGAGLRDLALAAVTIATMIGLNVWTRGAPKIFCAFIGMVLGYLVAAAAGLITGADLAVVWSAPLVQLPGLHHPGWAFEASMIVPFLVAALATSIRTMGDVTICQRTNDAEWVRPDMKSIAGGVLANGLANVGAGLVGSLGVSTYTSSVGLAATTGVTSRRVGYAIGGIFAALAFLPKVSAFLVIMPSAVMGAALLFSACFIFVNGLQIITSRLLDVRRTIVIGLSFLFGMSVDLYPGAFAAAPSWLQPLVSSSLVLGTLSALVLNVVFRLGLRRVRTVTVVPGQFDAKAVEDFIEAQGAEWGARRDVIDRASFNLAQSLEAIIEGCAPSGPMLVEASFDEFNLDLRVTYAGAPLELPLTRPTNEEIMASEEGQHRLAGFMLRRYADRVDSTHHDGRTTLLFHFDH